MTPPRVLAAAGVSAGGNPGKDVGASLRGASGTPPPAVCPGMGGSGSLPLIRPCGATFPQGGRQGLLLAAAQASAGRRGRRPLRFAGNGRQREAAPHPALWGHLPPRGKVRAVVEGFIPPGVLAAAGGRGGVGAPRPTDGDMETPAGFTRTPVPGPPHGRGRACPAWGVTQAPVNGSVRREGS